MWITSGKQDIQPRERELPHPAGTEPADEVIASSGVTFQSLAALPASWLLCLLFPSVSLVREPI